MNQTLALALSLLAPVPASAAVVQSGAPHVSTTTVAASPALAALKSWVKPTAIQVVGGVVPWDKEYGPGGGGSAYVSFQPFSNKYLKPVTIQPGFGWWAQKTSYSSGDTFRAQIQSIALVDRIAMERTVTRQVFDLGKLVYAPTFGRFTPYVGAGFATATRREAWKETERIQISVDGEPQVDETFVLDEGKSKTAKSGAYLNAGLKVAVNRSWSALADYATSPILGPRLSLGVQYLLR